MTQLSVADVRTVDTAPDPTRVSGDGNSTTGEPGECDADADAILHNCLVGVAGGRPLVQSEASNLAHSPESRELQSVSSFSH